MSLPSGGNRNLRYSLPSLEVGPHSNFADPFSAVHSMLDISTNTSGPVDGAVSTVLTLRSVVEMSLLVGAAVFLLVLAALVL